MSVIFVKLLDSIALGCIRLVVDEGRVLICNWWVEGIPIISIYLFFRCLPLPNGTVFLTCMKNLFENMQNIIQKKLLENFWHTPR